MRHAAFGQTRRRAASRWLCLAAGCAVLALCANPSMATSLEALNGAWRIDFDASLAVNEQWNRAYNGYGIEARAAMRESLGARELAVDMKGLSMKDWSGKGKERLYRLREIHNHGAGVRMTVAPEKSAPYFVDIVMRERDVMRLTVEGQEPIILRRISGTTR